MFYYFVWLAKGLKPFQRSCPVQSVHVGYSYLAIKTLPTKHYENMDEVWWAILEFGLCRISLCMVMSDDLLQGGSVELIAHPVQEWLSWFPSVWLHTLHELRVRDGCL